MSIRASLKIEVRSPVFLSIPCGISTTLNISVAIPLYLPTSSFCNLASLFSAFSRVEYEDRSIFLAYSSISFGNISNCVSVLVSSTFNFSSGITPNILGSVFKDSSSVYSILGSALGGGFFVVVVSALSRSRLAPPPIVNPNKNPVPAASPTPSIGSLFRAIF